MSDPLEVLREPDEPVAPDPSFALGLRARIERALELPRGVAVTTALQIDAPDRPDVSRGAAVPYLAVRDARAAIDWYVTVFGAVLEGDPIEMPDGRIGHAELALAGGKLYLADEFPDIGVVAPRPEAAAVSLVLAVQDVDARVAATTAAGGRLTREIAEAHGSRNAVVIDPFGHRWMLQQALTAATAGEAPPAPWRQGDAGYVSIETIDVERAAAFYAAVLGWTYEPSHTDQGRQVAGQSMPMGLVGGHARPNLRLSYVVGDTDAAVARVRAAGGQAPSPVQTRFGPLAMCTDPRGVQFAVHAAHAGAQRPPANGARQGDVSYLTYEAVDSEQLRDFYGAVLGWDFTPGSVPDGWQVPDVTPMSGVAGGAAVQTTVPMWRVDDVEAAVRRVRAAGGTATDPAPQPYGLTSDCYDDQGMHFHLGQL